MLLVRSHAMAATVLWSVLMVVHLPTFVFAVFPPAFRGESPRSWAVAIVVSVIATSWVVTAIGLFLVRRTARRRSSAGALRA